MSYSIYTLSDPRTNEVFYVGCTSYPQSRKQEHCHYHITPKTPVQFYLVALRQENVRPIFTVIKEVAEDGRYARKWESEYIRHYRAQGYRLYNGK